VASPTERADTALVWDDEKQIYVEPPPDSQVVTPEDIRAGWRVLDPGRAAQALAVARDSEYTALEGTAAYREATNLIAWLAGVPGKDTGTCPVCQRPEARLVDGACVSGCGYVKADRA